MLESPKKLLMLFDGDSDVEKPPIDWSDYVTPNICHSLHRTMKTLID